MTITKAQLRTLIGRELEILPSNRSALNAADGALVDEYIDGVRAWLIEEGNCYWSASAIPEAVKLPLAYLVAQHAAASFNKPYSKGDAGYQLIKQHVAAHPSGEPTRADFS